MRFLVNSSFPILFLSTTSTLTQGLVALVQVCWLLNASVGWCLPILVVKYSDHHSYIKKSLNSCHRSDCWEHLPTHLAHLVKPFLCLLRLSLSSFRTSLAPFVSSVIVLNTLDYITVLFFVFCFFRFYAFIVGLFSWALFSCFPLKYVLITW